MCRQRRFSGSFRALTGPKILLLSFGLLVFLTLNQTIGAAVLRCGEAIEASFLRGEIAQTFHGEQVEGGARHLVRVGGHDFYFERGGGEAIVLSNPLNTDGAPIVLMDLRGTLEERSRSRGRFTKVEAEAIQVVRQAFETKVVGGSWTPNLPKDYDRLLESHWGHHRSYELRLPDGRTGGINQNQTHLSIGSGDPGAPVIPLVSPQLGEKWLNRLVLRLRLEAPGLELGEHGAPRPQRLDLIVFQISKWATRGSTPEFAVVIFRSHPASGSRAPREGIWFRASIDQTSPGVLRFKDTEFDGQFLELHQGDFSDTGNRFVSARGVIGGDRTYGAGSEAHQLLYPFSVQARGEESFPVVPDSWPGPQHIFEQLSSRNGARWIAMPPEDSETD